MAREYFYVDKEGKTQNLIYCVRGCPEPYKKEDLFVNVIKVSEHAHMCQRCCRELGLKDGSRKLLLGAKDYDTRAKSPEAAETEEEVMDIELVEPMESLDIPESERTTEQINVEPHLSPIFSRQKTIAKESTPEKSEKALSSSYVYVLKCADGTYYIGVTSDISNCAHAHNTNKGSKFTRPIEKKPVTLICSQEVSSPEETKKVKTEYEKKYLAEKPEPVVKPKPVVIEEKKTGEFFHAYIIKCADGTFYSGVTSDIGGCVHAHNTNKGSKFTRPIEKKPVTMLSSRRASTMEEAKKLKIELDQQYKK